jgi:hypothetical protein
MDLCEIGGGVSGFNWLVIGTRDGLFWTRWWTFGFWHDGVSYLCCACHNKHALFHNAIYMFLRRFCRKVLRTEIKAVAIFTYVQLSWNGF